LEKISSPTWRALVWRKQNFATFSLAERARTHSFELRAENSMRNFRGRRDSPLKTWSESERDNLEQAIDDVINQAGEELGEASLVKIGDTASVKPHSPDYALSFGVACAIQT
jgi:hypothetical protein